MCLGCRAHFHVITPLAAPFVAPFGWTVLRKPLGVSPCSSWFLMLRPRCPRHWGGGNAFFVRGGGNLLSFLFFTGARGHPSRKPLSCMDFSAPPSRRFQGASPPVFGSKFFTIPPTDPVRRFPQFQREILLAACETEPYPLSSRSTHLSSSRAVFGAVF